MMVKAGFLDQLGQENACESIDLALKRSRELMAASAGAQRQPRPLHTGK
jgi:hypothetical protein